MSASTRRFCECPQSHPPRCHHPHPHLPPRFPLRIAAVKTKEENEKPVTNKEKEDKKSKRKKMKERKGRFRHA